jgi:hypothetical protein
MRIDKKSLAATIINSLYKIQNECLRKATEVYKRTLRVVLERETDILLIDLYIEINKYRRIDNIIGYKVEK